MMSHTTRSAGTRWKAELLILKEMLTATEHANTLLNCWMIRRSPDAITLATTNTGENAAMSAIRDILRLPDFVLGASPEIIETYLLASQLDDTAMLSANLDTLFTYLSEKKKLLIEGSPLRNAVDEVLFQINGTDFTLRELAQLVRSDPRRNHMFEESVGPDGKPFTRVVGDILSKSIFTLYLLLKEVARSYNAVELRSDASGSN